MKKKVKRLDESIRLMSLGDHSKVLFDLMDHSKLI